MTIGPMFGGLTHPVPVFGRGITDVISYVTQKVDSNDLTQLLVTDLGGMVLPRTGIELVERGPDMGRETFIREISGTISNVFLAGWMGFLALMTFNGKLLNNKLFRTNKLGIHTGAWINASSLDYYGRLFTESLNHSRTPIEARRKFIETLLANMRTTDQAQAYKSMTGAIETFSQPQVKERMAAISRDHLREGRLSPQALEKLVAQFAQSDRMHTGTYTVHEQVARFADQMRRYGPVIEKAEKLIRADSELQKLPAKQARKLAIERVIEPLVKDERVKLSREAEKAIKGFMNELTETAIQGGLSDQLNLLDDTGKVALKDRHLGTMLREIKFFLEQYVDRVLSNEKTGKLLTGEMTDEFRRQVVDQLYRKGNTGLLSRFLPGAKDGLITFTRKSKTWLTVVPYLLSVMLSISVAFLNNWLTQRKHGGQVFFPGEGGPGSSPGHGPAQQYAALALQGRAQGPFQMFQQQRASALPGGR
jgi:hypothetical protein